MPKKNQIPFFASQALSGGITRYYWKPSPKLRRLGWKTLVLGDDFAGAVQKAIEQNRKLEATGDAGTAESAVRIGGKAPVLWREAQARYFAHPEFTDKAATSQRTYRIYMRVLEQWAKDGNLPMRDIDHDMVWDLRNALVGNPDSGKARTKLILAVLATFLKWCKGERIITVNPAKELSVPTPKARRRRLLRDELAPLLEAARELGHEHIELGIPIGFYTMQREKDLLEATAFRIGELTEVSAFARRTLANDKGRVIGLNLQQSKTQTWVGIPLHPIARQIVEDEIARLRASDRTCTHLILYPKQDRACPAWLFQLNFRETVNHAVAKMREQAKEATERQEHALAAEREKMADRLHGIQFRDLRRSGMCWMRELGVSVAGIASISGHSIEQTQKILDTYMPRDTHGAAEAMAMAVAREAELDAIEAAEREGEA